ncbi:MAG: hypothetical protein J5860_00495 [Clostridia bacterium]|nr:hypothetical protein [Clostridia bacterium]
MKEQFPRQRLTLGERWRHSGLYRVYNWKTEHGRGRACMLLNSIFSGLAGQFSGSIFYSAFLLAYGFDLSEINVLLFVPYITTFLYLFSPALLERFKKRKTILAVSRVVVHTINILGITLLPMLFEKDENGNIVDKASMTAAFVVIILTANAINALFSQGYSAWHANFLTDDIRADYFTSSQCINAMVYVAVFLVSLFADSLKDTAGYMPFLTTMRFVAYGLAMIDIIFLLIPKEYEYPKTVDKPKIKYVFTLPFKNKQFLMTIAIIVMVTFAMNIHAGYIDAYIIKEIKVPLALTNGINALYFAFFIMFGAMWKKFIAKHTWFRALGFALIIEGFSYLTYSFIAPGYLVLYTVVRLWQHVMGVVRGTIIASLPYLNLPESDRTNYLAFYTIVNNMGAFAARILGQVIYENVGKSEAIVGIFSAVGINGAVPILIFSCAMLEMLVAIPCFAWFKKATPQPLLSEYYARKEAKKAYIAQKKQKNNKNF